MTDISAAAAAREAETAPERSDEAWTLAASVWKGPSTAVAGSAAAASAGAEEADAAAGMAGDGSCLSSDEVDSFRVGLAAAEVCPGLYEPPAAGPPAGGLVTDGDDGPECDGEVEEFEEDVCDGLLRSCFLLAMSSCS